MVSLTVFFRQLFGFRKKSDSNTLPPPPDYGEICSSPYPIEKPPSGKGAPFLNPNLHFTADEIEAHLSEKDARFAAAVVELMLPRLKLGVWQEPVGWGHYSFALEKVHLHSLTQSNRQVKGDRMSLRRVSV